MAQNGLPHEMFERPSSINQLTSQIVQQLRMTRGFARSSEVINGAHEATADRVLPDAIGEHACREPPSATFHVRKPVSQLNPPAVCFWNRRGRVADHAEKAARDFIAETIELSSDADRFVGGPFDIAGDHGAGRDFWGSRKVCLNLSEELLLQSDAEDFGLAEIHCALCDGICIFLRELGQCAVIAALQEVQG